MAHFVRRWLQMPAELAGQPRVVQLERIYETATGVPLRDLLVVGVGLWATAVAGNPEVAPGYFANLDWPQDRLDRALSLITIDLPTLRHEVRQEIDMHGVEWAISIFERYPVVRIRDGGLLVVDPLLLLRRTYGWLPMFDVVDSLRRGPSPDRPLARQVEGCVRHLAELYTFEVLRSIVGPGPHGRLYDEDALSTAYGRPGTRIADAAVDYGDGWIVVEITSSQLRRESVAGMSDQALEGDLDKLVDKIAQIDSTISALRGDEASLTGAGPPVFRQFHPLLVVAEGFPVNPITLTVLRERMQRRNLLSHADTAPLEVVDVEELELVEALQEEGGPSLRDLLRAKRHAGLANMGLRDYIIVELGRRPTRPRRVEQLWSHAIDPVLDALRRQGTAA